MPSLGSAIKTFDTLVNGHRYSYSSIEFAFGPVIEKLVTEINYSDSSEIGKIRGTSPRVKGRSKGTEDATASIVVYKAHLPKLLGALAVLDPTRGFKEIAFDVSVIYAETGEPPSKDTIVGCRILGIEDSHSEGADILTSTINLDPISISWSGFEGYSNNPVTGLLP